MSRKKKKQLAVIDAETPPFKYGRDREALDPFAWEFFTIDKDGTKRSKQFWGPLSTVLLLDYLAQEALEGRLYTIYAHNGGKFDFYFLLALKAITNPVMIINGRIVKCMLHCGHELRDSYAIIPEKLAAYNKDEIDYAKFESDVRENHKDEILSYLHTDCVSLYTIVNTFIERFGSKLTVAAAAMSELQKLHPVFRYGDHALQHDQIFRQYYFGGRVEFFEIGHCIGPFKIYDVNSMYPKAMRDYWHPKGSTYIVFTGQEAMKNFDFATGHIIGLNPHAPFFIQFTGENRHALPIRDLETGRLVFDKPYGTFNATSHEVQVAIELGLIRIDEIHEIRIAANFQRYTDFVEKFIAEKIEGKLEGNKPKERFAKLILNAPYGKQAVDSMKYEEWFIVNHDDEESVQNHTAWMNQHTTYDEDGFIVNAPLPSQTNDQFGIWSVEAPDPEGFYDVAVAASITGAARSILMRALQAATRPVYCDTDSIICQEMGDVDISSTELGAWKFEGSTKEIFIGGKKIYTCILDGEEKIAKSACKGANLSHEEIVRVALGETVLWRNDAPNFKISGATKFVERNIRMVNNKSNGAVDDQQKFLGDLSHG